MTIFLTGGATNANPNASLGGITSSTQMGVAINNLFDNVSSAEATAGDTEYRAIAVKNQNATLTAFNSVIYISSNTPSTFTNIEIGLDASGTVTAVDENTAPAGVIFTSPSTEATGIFLGDMAPGAEKRIWVKRVVTAGALAVTDSATLTVAFDSPP